MKTQNSIDPFNPQLQEREDARIELIWQNRLNNTANPFCPGCSRLISETYRRESGKSSYECDICWSRLSPIAGSIYAGTHAKLWKWWEVKRLMIIKNRNVNPKELLIDYGGSWKTYSRMIKRIEKQMDACGEHMVLNTRNPDATIKILLENLPPLELKINEKNTNDER